MTRCPGFYINIEKPISYRKQTHALVFRSVSAIFLYLFQVKETNVFGCNAN